MFCSSGNIFLILTTVEDMKEHSKLPRREFLANLLFAGGVLSVGGLQSEYGLLAKRDPKKETDGWELPDDLKESRPKTEPDGWELPEDLMDPPPVIRQPPPRPQPPVRGRVCPPRPPGSLQVPPPDGGVKPPIKGKVKAPRPAVE